MGIRRAAVSRDSAVLSMELPGRPEAASAARKAMTALNGSLHLVSEERLRDLQLLVSELVTNAIRHGGTPGESPIGLRVEASEEVLRVEVTDIGPGFDPSTVVRRPAGKGGGFGLRVIAALTERWGVDRGDKTRIWFEFARPQVDAPLPVEGAPMSQYGSLPCDC